MNKTLRGLAAGLIAAVALTGCSNPTTTAAKVGDVVISEAVVQEAVQAISTIAQNQPATLQRSTALGFIMGEAAKQMAAKNQLTIDPLAKQALIASQPTIAAVSTIPGGAAWVDAVTTATVVMGEMGQEDFAGELRNLSVELNPRYGAWDATGLGIADGKLALPRTVQP